MQKQNKFGHSRKFFIAPIVLFFSLYFCTFSAQAGNPNEESETYIDINQDTTWHSSENLILNKTIYVNPGATLTIEKGANIVFEKDVDGNETSLNILGGKLMVNGTQNELVRISANQDNQYYIISFRNDHWDGYPEAEPSFLRYVEISGGGVAYGNGGGMVFNNFLRIPSALAYFEGGSPAVYFESGKVHMENCRFYNNNYADIGVQYNELDSETGTDNYLEIVNSNFEKNLDSLALKSEVWCQESEIGCANKIRLKNNWYDSSAGPLAESNPQSDGKEIYGYALIDNWRINSLIADPVVVVPGIMGSDEVFGELKIDPILHTYDNLIESLEKNGYEKNKNLFEFPYEWRNNNETSANYLQSKVEGTLSATRVSKVDLVAHSMGGLVARAYIEETADGIQYNNTIDQLITLGTPHKGSPEAYLKWEAGEGFLKILDKLAKHHFKNEAEHNGYNNIFSYLQEKVTSVKDLLPDYDYLSESGTLRTYPDNYPRNIFLEELNKSENLDKLKNVNFLNIIGNLDNNKSTISKIRVSAFGEGGLWEHGVPENFYANSTDQGLEYSEGDETVPIESSNSIEFAKTIEINSSHGDLPTEAQCQILSEIANIQENNCQKVDKWHIANILLFNIFSPIDIQIIAPDGKRVGKNFETGEILNEIEGAFYSGYETNSEFLTIPNPIDGQYKILTQGTGDGSYKIEATKISEDPATQKASESTGTFEGTASVGQQEEKTIEVKGSEVIGGDSDSEPEPEPEPVTIDSIITDVNNYYSQGLIKTNAEKKFLLNRLNLIKRKIERIEKWNNNPKLPAKAKNRLISALKKQINKKINNLIKHINLKKNKRIDSQVKADLIDKLNLTRFN